MMRQLASLGTSNQFSDCAQEFIGVMTSFGIESIRNYPTRDAIAGFVCPTDRDYHDFRKVATHHREELEARHLWHVEVGDDEVRHLLLDLQESIETMFGSSTSYPPAVSSTAELSRILASSSTTRILCLRVSFVAFAPHNLMG